VYVVSLAGSAMDFDFEWFVDKQPENLSASKAIGAAAQQPTVPQAGI